MYPFVDFKCIVVVTDCDTEYFGLAVLIGKHEGIHVIALVPRCEWEGVIKDFIDHIQFLVAGHEFFRTRQNRMGRFIEGDRDGFLVCMPL